MGITDRSMGEYFRATWKYLAVVAVGMGVITVLRLQGVSLPPMLETMAGIVVLGVTGWAGWTAVRRRDFSVRQTIPVGIWLAVGAQWAVPLFHAGLGNILAIMAINTCIYTVAAAAGGGLARVSRFVRPM